MTFVIEHICAYFFQDMFEKVNKAYEFLCSKSKITEGPDPKNIVLVLKAQSILFSRYKEGDIFWILKE